MLYLVCLVVLPFVFVGNQESRERKPTLLEVAEISSNVSNEPARESSVLLGASINENSLEKSTLDKELKGTPMFVEETQLASAPLAVPETSTSSDSSADVDQSNEVALSQVDGRKRMMYNERSSETESLLSDVLESADRIYTKHLQGRMLIRLYLAVKVLKNSLFPLNS